ncbi:MAG TPA: hypothetical protein VG389_21815 [Myxococcota bacterium]|nr:hypothetical protein [Myxococcota bacterium]
MAGQQAPPSDRRRGRGLLLTAAALLLLAISGVFLYLIFGSDAPEADRGPTARSDLRSVGGDQGVASAVMPAATAAPAPVATVLALTATPLAPASSARSAPVAAPPHHGTARIAATAPTEPGTAAPREDPLGIGLSMTTENLRDKSALFRPARWIWAGDWGGRKVAVTLTLYDLIDREGGDVGEMLVVENAADCSWEGLGDLDASFNDARVMFQGGADLDHTAASGPACSELPREEFTITCDRPTAEELAVARTLPRLSCRIARPVGGALAALFRPH